MAQRSALDPFGLAAEFAALIEKVGNQAGIERLKSPETSKAMNQLLAVALGAQQLSRRAQKSAFKALNLPTRDDLLAVERKLQAIDERLMALADLLQSGAPATTALAMPPRTKKAPAVAPVAPVAPPAPVASAPESAPAMKRTRKPAARKSRAGKAKAMGRTATAKARGTAPRGAEVAR